MTEKLQQLLSANARAQGVESGWTTPLDLDGTTLRINGNCRERFAKRVTDSTFSILCSTLQNTGPIITEIDASFALLSDEGALALAELLRKNVHIQFVNVAHNEIGHRGCAAIADALLINSGLMGICLRGNPIGEFGGLALGTMLKANTTLMSLDVGQCELTTKALVSMFIAMGPHPAICSLRIDKPLLPAGPQDLNAVVQHLTQLLRINKNIAELTMDYFGLCDEHLRILLPCLVQCDALQVVSFVGNKFSRDGGVLLGRLLGRRPDLTRLAVDGNRFGNVGAVAIAASLKDHGSLQQLSMRRCAIGDVGLAAIGESLCSASALRTLLIYDNNQFEALATSIFSSEPLVQRMKKLKEIDFDIAHNPDGTPVVVQRN